MAYTFDYSIDFLKELITIPPSYFGVTVSQQSLRPGDSEEDEVGGIDPKQSSFQAGQAVVAVIAGGNKEAAYRNEETSGSGLGPRQAEQAFVLESIENIDQDIQNLFVGVNANADNIGPNTFGQGLGEAALQTEMVGGKSYESVHTSANRHDCLIHAFLLSVSPRFRKLSQDQKDLYASWFRRSVFARTFDVATEPVLREQAFGNDFLEDTHAEKLISLYKINLLTWQRDLGTLGVSLNFGIFHFDLYMTGNFILMYNPGLFHFRAVKEVPTNKYFFTNEEGRTILKNFGQVAYYQAEMEAAQRMPLPNNENEEEARPSAASSSAAAAASSSAAAAGLQRNNGHNLYFEEKEKQKAAAASASFPTPLVKELINSQINTKEALARIKAGTASEDDFKTISVPLINKVYIEGTNDPEVYHDLATFYSDILPRYLYSEFYPEGAIYEERIIDNYIQGAKRGYKPSREKLDELVKLMKQQNKLDLVDYIYNSMLSEKILTEEEVAAAKAATAAPSSAAAAKANANAEERARKLAALGVAPPPSPSSSKNQAELNEERRIEAVDRVLKNQNPTGQDYEYAKQYWENHMQENEAFYSNYLGVLYINNLIEKELSEKQHLDRAKGYFLASATKGNEKGKYNLYQLGKKYFEKKYYDDAAEIFLEILENSLYTANMSSHAVYKNLEISRSMAEKARGLKGGNRTRKVKRTS